MKKFRYIETIAGKRSATIWLNRPEVHNALNAGLIDELTFAVDMYNKDDTTDVLILRGRGKSFSSGADLNDMKVQGLKTERENYEDALKLAALFDAVFSCRKVVVTVVHGHVAGGANGLVACADYAIASESTIFRFSEVRLGLVPATVSPYVAERVGFSKAREMLLTGKSYNAREALGSGLINQSSETEFLDEVLKDILSEILKASPNALRNTKQMLVRMRTDLYGKDMMSNTAGILAGARSSAEGKEGVSAFLEKRKPIWLINN
jgi:methylglutaconyl-CoA hydratase